MGRDSAGVPVMRTAREAPFTSGVTACKRAKSDISNHRTVPEDRHGLRGIASSGALLPLPTAPPPAEKVTQTSSTLSVCLMIAVLPWHAAADTVSFVTDRPQTAAHPLCTADFSVVNTAPEI